MAAAAQDNAANEAMLKMAALQQRYTEEAAKRYRPDGLAQFVELRDVEQAKFQALAEDPWVDHAALNAQSPVQDGVTYKYLIVGTGYGGLLMAVRLIENGAATADDIRFVDAAGGFGGTWYWNRYPGIRCDVESYSYMPLLEETDYMPKFKYSEGPELLGHANRIASHFNLADKALFRATPSSMAWDDAAQIWTTKVTEGRGPGEPAVEREIRSQYVLMASGVLAKPQLAKIPGLDKYGGDLLHTARWNYGVSGGTFENQVLSGLEGKRVGIVGTGATGVQVIPAVARYAKDFYVFQRTPSTVNWRGQKATDPDEYKAKVANKKGWQLDRMSNLNRHLTNNTKAEDENMVGDAWSTMRSYSAIVGSPAWGFIEPTPEKIGEHIGRMLAMDAPLAEELRQRVDTIVKDPDTASKLKAWYPTWCKRPTFSDEYLQAFNLPNVHLVDTDGKGVSSATEKGLVVGDTEYPLDVLIMATGYRSPAAGAGSPSAIARIEIRGRDGLVFEDKWTSQGAGTFHGVTSHGFPNLFFAGSSQSGSAANYVMSLLVITAHIGHVIGAAERRAGEGQRAVIEAEAEAQEVYCGEIMRRAAYMSTVTVCTPGYLTSEGQFTSQQSSPEDMMKAARQGPWTTGMESWMDFLAEWEKEGSLQGFAVKPVAAA